GLEGISRRQPPSQNVSDPDVSLLPPGHPCHLSGEYCLAAAHLFCAKRFALPGRSANLTTMTASSPSAQIRGVLFDWDGTLLNSYRADSAAYLAMFRQMGIPWTLDDLAQHYSPNWYRVYRAAKLPRARWDDADRAWRKQYATHRPRLMPGARRVLKHLRARHQLGVVTSGDRDRVVRQ